MIVVPHYAGRRMIVTGLARSGLAAARALAEGGADVAVWDDQPARRDAATRERLPVVADLAREDWRKVTALVMSPGVPLTHPSPHPVVGFARAAGVRITGDIALLRETEPQATICAITGTNGKSTTTALLGHVLQSAGRRAAVGGNLGTAALDLTSPGPGGIYVLELSSYQLDLYDAAPFELTMLLNVAPDHLDRHGSMTNYIAAKRRIFTGQTAAHAAIVGIDDAVSASIAEALESAHGPRVVRISRDAGAPAAVRVEGTTLVDAMDGGTRPVADLAGAAALPGRHNAQNAAAAYAAARLLGVPGPTIAAALTSYPGLRHRQELVAVVDGVGYVNDSKATNADAAGYALACYETVYWIAGGVAKEGGIAGLAPLFPRIAHAFVIGEAAATFAGTLAGRVPTTRAGDLATAVAAARERALAERRPGAVVLLSPAAASFDQFRDFEDRGERFRSIVLGLPGRRVVLDAAESAA